ncbi:hypothetical protein L3Q82_012482 [Scortum barcoo]|uniref:Uncharacterized protein n=1 Tax=Scortum barcoo TaxID=214431 RepID=A0ACB8W5U8_9TELE|nr:hypothetical protein L3Q82_012482 [Scortum barcoo]
MVTMTAVFQSFINEVLREYLNDFVFVYLDDILIFSPDPVTHQRHVRQVRSRLLEYELYVKVEKSATGLSPFYIVYGYHPPLFPANEKEVTVPSAHAMARRCRKDTSGVQVSPDGAQV